MPGGRPFKKRFGKGRRDFKKGRRERSEIPPLFVPKQIEDRMRRLPGVIEVKPVTLNHEEIEIILVMSKPWNHEMHAKILEVEAEFRHSLRSRKQRFYASISWA